MSATGKGSKFYVSEDSSIALADKVGSLTNIGEITVEADEIETTDLDSGDYKEFDLAMLDSGSIDIEGNLKEGEDTFADLLAYCKTKKKLYFGITHPTLTSGNVGFRGQFKSVTLGSRTVNDLVTFSATVRISGAVSDFNEPTA